MITAKKKWWYWMFGIGIVQQALLIVGIAWYCNHGIPTAGFFCSPTMLSVFTITSIAIVFMAASPLIEYCSADEGSILLGAGFILGGVFWNFGFSLEWWMVSKVFLTLAFWSIVVGVLILLRVACETFYEINWL